MKTWTSTSGSTPFEVRNPATDEVIASVVPHSADEIDEYVRAAAAAQQAWRSTTIEERSVALRAAAQIVRTNMADLAQLETRENGKPLDQAMGDVGACAALFDMFAGLIVAERGLTRRTAFSIDLTERVPYGVVAAIIPFNWPPIHTAGKVAPALATGNAVVLKPGEQCPLVATAIIELIAEVFPAGLVAIVQGGPDQVRTLVHHRDVRKVGFTGSPQAGSAIIKLAADTHTPTLMELGGKDCLIVCEDADVEEAAGWAFDGGFFNQGESCTAASRMIVHEAVYDEFVSRFLALSADIRVGDGAEPGVQVGPLVDRKQRDRVLDYIEVGRHEGAEVLFQARLDGAEEPYRSGYFVPPTVFAATPDMRVAREEIFGPVVTVLKFRTEAEAISIANDTDYGLIAGVFSADTARALRIIDGLDVGMTLVNNYNRGILGSPFGGTKASGFGREHCQETLMEYSYAKVIRIPSGQAPVPRWGIQQGARAGEGNR